MAAARSSTRDMDRGVAPSARERRSQPRHAIAKSASRLACASHQPGWRNGRRSGFKNRPPQGDGGSSPPLGTSFPGTPSPNPCRGPFPPDPPLDTPRIRASIWCIEVVRSSLAGLTPALARRTSTRRERRRPRRRGAMMGRRQEAALDERRDIFRRSKATMSRRVDSKSRMKPSRRAPGSLVASLRTRSSSAASLRRNRISSAWSNGKRVMQVT